jgi:hypothetical protein
MVSVASARTAEASRRHFARPTLGTNASARDETNTVSGQELTASVLAARAKRLYAVLEQMLGGSALLKALYEHPLIKKLSTGRACRRTFRAERSRSR